MFKHFAILQWKSFFRSASLGKSLAVKILMGFFGLYMLGTMLTLGFALFFALKEMVPETDPLILVSRFLIYWVLIDLVLRYFMQKLPVMDVKPMLTIPIAKNKITHYILGRSGISIYNLFDVVFFIPFTLVLLFQGYPFMNVMGWFLAMMGLVLTINYLNFLINKSDKALLIMLGLVVALYCLDYFDLYPVRELAGNLFYGLYENPIFSLLPILLAVGTYYLNYSFLRKTLFLDA